MKPGRQLVCVITVVRNGKTLPEKAIRSVLEQSCRGIEYIIIDGGSCDGTIDVIRKYEDRISFRMSEPDRGIYEAMNNGIDRSNGFLDKFYECR
jgi:glycosyltransferase involved in cell wall biosynthesis